MLRSELIIGDRVRGDLWVRRKGMKRVAALLAPDCERYLLPLLE